MLKQVFFYISFTFLFSLGGIAQCFQVSDGNGVLSTNPYFISCTPGSYTVFIQTDLPIGPYSIDWGDGTLPSTGASLVPPVVVQHTMALQPIPLILSLAILLMVAL